MAKKGGSAKPDYVDRLLGGSAFLSTGTIAKDGLAVTTPNILIDTGACDYLTVVQHTARAVSAGELLKLRLWHFELSAPAPAQAHAAVVVDSLTVLDELVAIPAAGGLIVRELRAPHDLNAGAPVYFHLHNHGANSWALVELSAGD